MQSSSVDTWLEGLLGLFPCGMNPSRQKHSNDSVVVSHRVFAPVQGFGIAKHASGARNDIMIDKFPHSIHENNSYVP